MILICETPVGRLGNIEVNEFSALKLYVQILICRHDMSHKNIDKSVDFEPLDDICDT